MSYQPKTIPLEELQQTAANMAADAHYDVVKILSRKIAKPQDVRRKKYMADFWHSINQSLIKLKTIK